MIGNGLGRGLGRELDKEGIYNHEIKAQKTTHRNTIT